VDFLIQYGYAGLFASSFLAATFLPVSSEIVLSALLLSDLSPTLLVLVATIGNVLGSVVNYIMGYSGCMLLTRKVSHTLEREINASIARFKRYGAASLLFAWLPVVGDPLTLAAGVLRVNILLFLLLVTIGKMGRYIAIAWLI